MAIPLAIRQNAPIYKLFNYYKHYYPPYVALSAILSIVLIKFYSAYFILSINKVSAISSNVYSV